MCGRDDRYTLMANTLLLFLLTPDEDSVAGAEEGVALAKHALQSSCTELAPLRVRT